MANHEGMKRLFKSRTERMIDGVCGGIAEYFNVDPTLVRIVTVLLALSGGVGIILYFAGMIIMPTNPAAVAAPSAEKSSAANHRFWGILLVVLGGFLFMLNMGWDFWNHWWWFSWGTAIPVVLILAGVAFLFGGRNYVSSVAPAAPGLEQSQAPTTPHEVRRLRRSRAGKKIFGVCSGLGEYFGVDPVIVRILFVVGACASFGFVILMYLIMAIVVPREPLAQSA